MFDNISLDDAKKLLEKINKLAVSYIHDDDADAREHMIEVYRELNKTKKELKKQVPLA